MPSNPTDILYVEPSEYPWRHIIAKDILDDQTRLELIDIFNTVSWDTADNSDTEYTSVLNIHNMEIDHPFIKELGSSQFHHKVFNLYGIDDLVGYEYTLVFDYAEPKAFNEPHNDVNRFAEIITLQYYLKMDSESRQLKLSGVSTGASNGDAVMFKSDFGTDHSFDAGKGERYSLRLRLKIPLIDPVKLHRPSKDDISVIIDAKNMESHSGIRHFERRLARITYESCVQSGFTNIVGIEKQQDLEKALYTCPTDKVLILFAGALVSTKTYQWAKQAPLPSANVLEDLDRIARQFVLFDKTKEQRPMRVKGDYLKELMDHCVHTTHEQAGLLYTHPELESNDMLKNLIFFNISQLPPMYKQRMTELKHESV